MMLPNFVRERYGYNSGHTLYVKDLRATSEGVVQGAGKYANSICDHFASYSERNNNNNYNDNNNVECKNKGDTSNNRGNWDYFRHLENT